MTTAPLVPHPVTDSGINGGPGHMPNGLPRYHPIAMNPNPPHPGMPPPDQMVQNHHFRHFAPPLMHDPHAGPPPVPPTPAPTSLEQIEQRLRQLEHEEMNRMATRSHILAVRKREDEEFRRLTEGAEIEEEDLRRQRKRMKRESMGLGSNHAADSPPLRPTPPRRLSETSAATTLAFFKQQSPPEPRQAPLPVSQPQQAPPMPPPAHLHQPHQTHPHPSHPSHPPHTPHPSHPPHQPHQHHAPPPPQPQHHIVHHESMNGPGSIRRKQKYTIKNVEAWGERHGRPAAHDPSGRALWKRPSDGSLVYLTCPIQGCGKSDFVTLHGFMCHLTKKHKDRTLGSQSRALELCGVVFDPNSPLPPATTHRGSTESGTPMDHDGEQDEDLESDPEESEDSPESYRVKTEGSENLLSEAHDTPGPHDLSPVPAPRAINGSVKQSISSIIDRTPEPEPREALASLAPSEPGSKNPTPVLEQMVPVKRKFEYSPEKENTEPKEGSATE